MKKTIAFVCLSVCLFFGGLTKVNAYNSAHAYEYGYVVNASIYPGYFSGSVTGSYSNGSTITLYGWYYNSSHQYVYAGTSSNSVYLTWYKPSQAVSWGKGYAKGTVADGGYKVTDFVYIE